MTPTRLFCKLGLHHWSYSDDKDLRYCTRVCNGGRAYVQHRWYDGYFHAWMSHL